MGETVRGCLTIREIREEVHEIEARVAALLPSIEEHTRDVGIREYRAKVKSPWTHRTSRNLWDEVSKARYKLIDCRKGLRLADAALRFLDDEKPRLAHLKRIQRSRRRQESAA